MDAKENFSYLDGVPFAIGPKFCPPRDIALPLAVHYNLSPEIVVQQYDFDVENKVIEAARVKEGKKDDESLSNNEDSGSGKGCGLRKTLANHGAPSWNSNSILQPQFQMQNTNSDGAMAAVLQNTKKINLSDFENDTSSPFDYMELQTINDLEELNTVFQGMSENRKQPADEGTAAEENSTSDENQTIGNVSKSVSFPLSQNFDFNSAKLHNNVESNVSEAVPISKGFSKNSENYFSYSYPSMPSALTDSASVPSQADILKRNSFHGDKADFASPALTQVPSSYNNQNLCHAYTMHSSSNSNVPLRSSKSIPDLTNLYPEVAANAKADRSRTPPASVIEYANSGYNREIFVKSADHDNSVNKSEWSSNGVPTYPKSLLPDPYEELNDLEKQVVDSIHDMGFDRSQVSRSVKHLGTDQKKVVEHLCQVQVLEELGYDAIEAEAALHLHDYDKQEAIRFLDLLNQFQDLGFEKDAIKKALVQNKNDRDKVIDALLSSSSSS